MAPRFWLLSLLLLGCTKTNKVELDAPSEQSSTCLTACQWAAKTGTDEASPWCGLPVPTGGTKGSDLTACQKDCSSQATPQSVLTCTDSAKTCEEIRACGLLQKK